MKIDGLFVYPLKSARAIATGRAMVTLLGLAADRRAMLVDPEGVFITQREMPALAQVTALPQAAMMTLAMEGQDPLMVAPPDPGRRLEVTIWGSRVSAALAADSINARLSAWFDRPVRLVFLDHLSDRTANPAWAGDNAPMGFADGYQILVTTTGALAAVNRELEALGGRPVGMERFRPNVVIDYDEPFGEDFWASIRIGDVTLDLVKPCPRCVIVTQDQTTGARGDADPLPALRKLRLSEDRRATGVMFGWNAVPRGTGAIAVGDTVDILARRPDGWAFRER
jgi:hypothetical protein